MIDVRCSATLPSHRSGEHSQDGSAEARCQLFAGHDGPHAVMYARGRERLVRTWRPSGAPTDSDGLQRPWMFGYPTPAWFEDDGTPELTG